MSAQELNLIPADVLRRMALRRRAKFWARAGVAAIILAASSRFALQPLVARDQVRLAAAIARVQERRQEAMVVDSLRAERERLAGIIVERSAVLPDATLLDLFRALESSMPSSLYLRALSAEPAEGASTAMEFEVHLEGSAPATDLVAAFLFKLAGRSDMSSTELESSHRTEGEDATGVSFAVRLRYHPRDHAT